MSCVQVYNEKVEDLLVMDILNDTSAPASGLKLIRDVNGFVEWLGAKTSFVTSTRQMKTLYEKGQSEHIRRCKMIKGRLEAAHTIIRLILEHTPQNMKDKALNRLNVTTCYLDFVLVAGLQLVPTFTSLLDELKGDPPLTKSLWALHHFVTDPNRDKNELYDSRRSTLTQLLREMLVGKGRSVFLCVCDPSDLKKTQAILRFGSGATQLVQHPCKSNHPFHGSVLHNIISTTTEDMSVLLTNKQLVKDAIEYRDLSKIVKLTQKLHYSKMKEHVTAVKKIINWVFPWNNSMPVQIHRKIRRREHPKKLSIPKDDVYCQQFTERHFIGKWIPKYPAELEGNSGNEEITLITNFYDEIPYNIYEMKLALGEITDQRPEYYLMPGNIKNHDKSKYCGGNANARGPTPIRHQNGSLSLVRYVRGILTITKKHNFHAHSKIKKSYIVIKKDFKLENSQPMKVYFPLNMVEPAKVIGPFEDGYAHFHRLLLWLLCHRREFLVYNEDERKYEDGKVYIQSDRTLAKKQPKISFEEAFNIFLQGRARGGQESCSNKQTVKYMGDYWTVCCGEVDGLGLFYSSKVDVIEKWVKKFYWHNPKWLLDKGKISKFYRVMTKIGEKVMYKTHLYKTPVNTKAWRLYQWHEMFGWWADYQFGGIPNIIGGELEGSVVTSLRLFNADELPKLTKAWCRKKPWDPIVCEKYMASLLRFMKMCCSKAPRQVLSFGLRKEGTVLSIKKFLDNKEIINYSCDQILPDDVLKHLYPPPPPPKPGKKRGKKPMVKPQVEKPIPKIRRRPNRPKNIPWRDFKNKTEFSSPDLSPCDPSVEIIFSQRSPLSSDEDFKNKLYRTPLNSHVSELLKEIHPPTKVKKPEVKIRKLVKPEILKKLEKEINPADLILREETELQGLLRKEVYEMLIKVREEERAASKVQKEVLPPSQLRPPPIKKTKYKRLLLSGDSSSPGSCKSGEFNDDDDIYCNQEENMTT
ncbi:uncharacterized protein LOC121858667 isoform X2 [Homarus americanus]|uniref:uncharacterized protein LOC121858667 isoform X2 n=1 Tax=Homarus americanus TaxID=6706 RepID=UPI001C48BE7B|nr:uncharacterized protein LOC121858667 isoform X2 [Homarus americanus]